MTSKPIYREGENFFVPSFLVTLDGTRLKAGILRDVLSVTYRDSVSDKGEFNEFDSFEMTINNWDADAQKFKYEPHSSPDYKGIFEPGRELDLSMGYFNNMRLMLRGTIETLEPNFTESGPATLAIRGHNALKKFQKRQHTMKWEKKKDSEIAREIGEQRESEDRPGLGVPVRVDESAQKREPAEFVFMHNQFDIVFLLQRARRRGYAVHLRKDPNGDEYVHFGPSQDLRHVEYELEWGRSLSSFRPTFSTANQASSVTVRGWDRATQKTIKGKARIPDDCAFNSDQAQVTTSASQIEEVVTDRPLRNEQEARELAKNILTGIASQLIKGSGSTIGLPDLRAGSRVVIKGLGPRYSGSYFVTSSAHTIDSNGYRTTFESRREGPVEGGK
jgi:phage protein D